MNPVILSDNVFLDGTPAATDTAAGKDVLYIRDRKTFTSHKFAAAGTKYYTVDLNMVQNPGFETGDFTGWTQLASAIENSVIRSGAYSSKLVLTGTVISGAHCNAIAIDPAKTYAVSVLMKITGWSSGGVGARILCYDASGTSLYSPFLNATYSDIDWTKTIKTIGPPGSGADHEFPAGTVSISVQAGRGAGATPTMTAYFDDVLFYPVKPADTLFAMGHNWWSTKATVSVEYSTDDTEAITSWSEALAGFTPGDDYALMKTFTTPATPARAWRVKIVTTYLAPEVAVLLLGQRITLPYPPDAPYVHYDEGAEVEESESAEENHLLGVGLIRKNAKLELTVSILDRDWVTGIFKPWWNGYAIHRYPFALAVDLDEFPGDVLYGRLTKDYRFRMPLRLSGLAESLNIAMTARLER